MTTPAPSAGKARPIGISELVRLIGDENIQFQNVMHNLVEVKNPKHNQCSKLTVTIAPDIGQEFCAAVVAEQTPRKTGLILWFDTDKLTAALAKARTE